MTNDRVNHPLAVFRLSHGELLGIVRSEGTRQPANHSRTVANAPRVCAPGVPETGPAGFEPGI